jgi:spermidine/putrescine transport system permease protein
MTSQAVHAPSTPHPNPNFWTPALWVTGITVFLFIYMPMFVMVLFSFQNSKSLTWPFIPYSLQWYEKLLTDRNMLDSVQASLKLASITVVLSLIIGVPGAFVLDRTKFPGKVLFQRLVLLPLMLPGIITGIALLSFYSQIGLSIAAGYPIIPGWPVVLGHATALVSVVVTQVYARLQRFDRVQEEAAADLGANEWRTFWTVTLPNIRTALLGAALLVFTLSMDEIAVTYFLIGRQNTIPMEIFGRMRRIVDPEINAVSAIIFVASIFVIIIWARLMREE